ncbi:MAG TPA: peptidase S24 [Balneolaceae bacterium]|nr:peptidase S24 [Balneolaceae bacterium]|tara:strand:- start:91660 stop:92097 length:438 start_codon:yes stop_codon:yes gene_type:complete
MSSLKAFDIEKSSDDPDMLGLSRKIETGFPSPAGDHLEKALSLEELIIHRPAATFYVRAEGNGMNKSGIFDGDILVIDRSVKPDDGNIVVATVFEDVFIRRFIKRGNQIYLTSDDQSQPPVQITRDTEWMIWGVATYLIHRFRAG